VVAAVGALLEDPCPLIHLRQAQAILRLADTYPAARLQAACRLAAEADASYRTVRNILVNGLDQRADEATPPPSTAGAYLHGQQALLEGIQ